MEKRLIMALMLSIVVIFLWTTFVVKPQKDQLKREQESAPSPVVSEEAVREAPPPRAVTAPVEPVEELPMPPEKITYLDTDEMSVELSDVGGTIRRVVLKKFGMMNNSYELVGETPPEFRPFALHGSARLKYAVEGATDRGVTYKVRTDEGIEIRKSIAFSDEPYVLTVDITIKNLSDGPSSAGEMDIVCGSVSGLKTGPYAVLGVDCLVGDAVRTLKYGNPERLKVEKGGETVDASWVDARNSFFALILIPEVSGRNVFYEIYDSTDGATRKSMMAGLGLQRQVLAPDEELAYSFRLYAGPKEYDLLKAMGNHFDDLMYLGFFAKSTRWLGVGILKALKFFYSICGNYGIAIILLTIAIRIVLFPLNQKSFKSMKKMQDLAPLLEPLKKKYKDDPKKLQAETMALYKKQGVNPMSGCFPMLLQMPILIAFFQTLRGSVMLWGAHFLWIKDLSEPDAIFPLPTPFKLPLVGTVEAINLLPFLMLVVFFLQQKMSPTGMGGSTQAAQQQKMMGIIMPLFMGLIFYNMPSGLVLYFTVSTLLGIVQQYLVRREQPTAVPVVKKS